MYRHPSVAEHRRYAIERSASDVRNLVARFREQQTATARAKAVLRVERFTLHHGLSGLLSER